MRWHAQEIGEVAQINPKLATADRPDLNDRVSFVPMASVSEETKSIAVHEERLFSEVSRGYTPFMRGDVLVAKITPCFENGKMALADNLPHELGFGTTEFHVFRPSERVTGPYLFNLLRVPWLRTAGAMKMRGAAGQRRVPAEFIASVQIPLPPLAEQKRIAGILDSADALRAKRREALAQLDTLIQSTFLDMFGDPLTNSNLPSAIMTELVTKFIDYRGKSPEKSKGGVPLITAKIVKEKEVKEPNEFIPANSYDAWMRRGIPNPGDVVITTEAPMGEVALVPDYKAAFAQRLLVLQPDETKVNSIYLMWALTMPFVIRQLRQRSTGSTVTGIRSTEFKKVTLPIPSLDLQHHFAAIVESVEQQKGRQRAHLAELDTLFASLQSCAFRGDL